MIVENCFGIRSKHAEVYTTTIEDQILDRDDIGDSLQIIETGSASPPKQSAGHFKPIKGGGMVDITMAMEPLDLERKRADPKFRQEISELLDRAAIDSDLHVDIIIEDKIVTSDMDGLLLESFTINLVVESQPISRVRKSLNDIRDFDKEARHQISYEIPSLSILSRLR